MDKILMILRQHVAAGAGGPAGGTSGPREQSLLSRHAIHPPFIGGRYAGALRHQREREMNLLDLLRRAKRRVTPRLRIDDPTASWTPGEWADLPIHHPRSENGTR